MELIPEHHSYVISIHAPAKGATCRNGSSNSGRKFQSTLPRRERLYNPVYRDFDTIISIHAPAKGATANVFHKLLGVRFQSTLPRRERLLHMVYSSSFNTNFNPRSREGSDFPISSIGFIAKSISIHAPAKGATCIICKFGHIC